MPYIMYETQYNEDLASAEAVYENYKKQMSGREGFEARAIPFDQANHVGKTAIIFKQGAYTIWIEVSQQIMFTVGMIRIM